MRINLPLEVIEMKFLAYFDEVVAFQNHLMRVQKFISTSRKGLLVEDIKHGGRDPAGVDGGQQIRLGDDVGASNVDQSGTLD